MSATLTLAPPSEAAFGTDDFLSASELERLASRFCAEYPNHLGHVADVRLSVLWKRAGGKQRGQLLVGKAEKVSGLAKFWGESDFVVWLAADHLRGASGERIANCLFHELLHIGSDPDTGDAKLVGHDWEGFVLEVQERGLWREGMAELAGAFRQLALPLDTAAD